MEIDIKKMAKEIAENVISEEFILAAPESVETYIKMTDDLLHQHQGRKAFLASAMKPEDYMNIPVELVKKYTRKIENSLYLVDCVEDALADPELEGYLKLIDLFYFQHKTYLQTAEELFCSDNTIIRWRKKALKKLAIIIFGVDAVGLEEI